MDRIRWWQIVLCATLALFFVPQVLGVVEIVGLRNPPLFRVGEMMDLKCISNDQQGLYWTRESPATKWQEQRINITMESKWEERYKIIRPQGYVENILVRRHLQPGDGGNYYCYDVSKEHSFSTFIHVLQVVYSNVTATNSTVARITCEMTGFTTNPPRIDHSWVRGNVEITDGGRPDKYKISEFLGTRLNLDILNPSKEDTDFYTCNFILYQDDGKYVIYDQKVYLDANHLESRGSKVWSCTCYLVILLTSFAMLYI